MRTLIIAIVFQLIFVSSAFTQMNTGSLFASGMTGLNLETYKSTDLDTDNSENVSTFSFMPKAGYFLKNRIAIGAFSELSTSQRKSSDGDYSEKDTNTRFIFGPFGRYYFEYGTLTPFVEGSVGLGSEKYLNSYDGPDGLQEFDNKHSIFRLAAGGGVNYFFNESIAAEGMLQYFNETLKPQSEGATGNGHRNSGILFYIGITVFFGTI